MSATLHAVKSFSGNSRQDATMDMDIAFTRPPWQGQPKNVFFIPPGEETEHTGHHVHRSLPSLSPTWSHGELALSCTSPCRAHGQLLASSRLWKR